MPSRHSRKAKSNIESYGEKNKRAPAQSSSVITVTNTSPPEDILRASWKFLYIFQFLTLFRTQLNLPAISIERLESLFLFQPTTDSSNTTTTAANTPTTEEQEEYNINNIKSNNLETNILSSASSVSSFSSSNNNNKDHLEAPEYRTLAKIFIPILISLMEDKKRKHINENNYQHHIYEYLYNNSLDLFVQDILGKYSETIDFPRLTIVEKIYILKDLIDCIFETGRGLLWKNEVDPESMRVFPMGKDSEGWSYWIFGDTRLYREMPISPRKKETDYTFELIADNIEDWEKWINKYSKKSPKSLDKKLSDNLQEHGEPIIQKLEARKAAKLREEIRLEKAKIFEMIPRKKSRRLVVKSEEDDKKRQLEEMERAQIEYEILQREQEIKEQEEQLEREKQAMQIEEARLREEVYQLIDSMIAKKHSHNSNNDMSGNSETGIADNNNNNNNNNSEDPDDPSAGLDEAQLKQLRSKLKKSATYDEMIGKLKGWATLLNDDYQIYLADEEESYIDVEMKDSQPIANMDIDQSKTENTPNNNSNNSDNSIRLDQRTIVQNSDINDGQLQKTEPQEKIYATMENNILSSPPPPSSSVSISKTEDKPISTSENIFSKTLSLQNPTQPVDNSNVIIMNNNMEKNKEINNDNNDINSNSNIIDTNPKSENNESVLVTNDTITIPDIQSNIDESNYINGLESQKTVANKELREQQQLISDNNNDAMLVEPQSESVPMNNINESFNIIKSDLNNNSNNTKSTTKSKRGRPRKSKKTFITKQMTLLTFTQVIQFYGNGTRSDLRDPLLKLILSTILTHLRSQPVIIDMEKRNEKKIGKKRKNATNTVPPTIDFYTVHKKLLLDQYNEKESNMDQRQGIDTTTATTITNNNIDEEVIEFAAFEKWLYDMDILFLRNDKPFLEFKKHAYEVFLSVFKY